MIDVAVAIDLLAVPVTLRRRSVGTYNADGEFVPGIETARSISAAVQPATGRNLLDLPEGLREEARWLAWTREELRLDDVIVHGGQSFRVRFIWPRREGVGDFWRAAMGLLDT